jgi:hypothetical protein
MAAHETSTSKLFFAYGFHSLPTRVPTKQLNEICVYVSKTKQTINQKEKSRIVRQIILEINSLVMQRTDQNSLFLIVPFLFPFLCFFF